jgi:hypothetical protein
MHTGSVQCADRMGDNYMLPMILLVITEQLSYL